MSKLTFQGILAILKLIFKLLERISSLVNVMRDLLDDGLVNQSVSLSQHDGLSAALSKFEDLLNDFYMSTNKVEVTANDFLNEE